MNQIIALVGKAQSGKTSVSNHIIKSHRYMRIAFADALKLMLIKADMCTFNECYVKKTKQSRFLMQKLGTEIFREQVSESYWIDIAIERVETLLSWGYNVVIDDIRFQNEINALLILQEKLSNMLKVNVVRLVKVDEDGAIAIDIGEADNHVSERTDDLEIDHELRAKHGELELLYEGIDHIISGKVNND